MKKQEIQKFLDEKIDFSTYIEKESNPNNHYSMCLHQYMKNKRFNRWFTELYFNSFLTDSFNEKITELLSRKDINGSNFEDELEEIMKNNFNGNNNEIGHLFHFYNYSNHKFLRDENYRENLTLGYISDCFKKYLKNFINIDKYIKEFEKFVNIIYDKTDEARKKYENSIYQKIPFTKKELTKQIEKSTLNNILKNELLDRLKNKKLLEIYQEGLICELDCCIYFYETQTGESIYDENDNEKPEVEIFIKNHFKNNLEDFPVRIMTEDFITLYA